MASPDPDFDALAQALANDPENTEILSNFDAAFRPHVIAILASLYGNEADLAEDVYHTALIKFLDALRGQRKLVNAAYFVAIAKNCLLDELRRGRRYVPFDEVIEQTVRPTERNLIEDADTRISILGSMVELSPRCQFVLERYYIGETSIGELAAKLRIEPGSVYVVLQRCRDQLRNILRAMLET